MKRFSPEFVEGMAGSANRSRRLGDTGANAPANWSWGVGDKEPHILLILLFERRRAARDICRQTCWNRRKRAGLSKIDILPTSDMGDVEPFGFSDGVSQPSFDWDRPRTPGTTADRDYTNLLALGELFLGYRNEYGLSDGTPVAGRERKECRHVAEELTPAGSPRPRP